MKRGDGDVVESGLARRGEAAMRAKGILLWRKQRKGKRGRTKKSLGKRRSQEELVGGRGAGGPGGLMTLVAWAQMLWLPMAAKAAKKGC